MSKSAQRKPGARRAQVDWDDDPPSQTIGSVSSFSDDDDDSSESKHPTAVLWIPDIDSRHGWREFCIYPKPPKRERRPLGWK